MNKTEYMTTINEKLTAAEALCADLRKLRILQKITKDIPNAAELVSSEALSRTITAKETELKAVRGELQKARRIVKKMEEIEAIESGKAPTPAKKGSKKSASKIESTPDAKTAKPAPKASSKTAKAITALA